jgi:hypothetical protein
MDYLAAALLVTYGNIPCPARDQHFQRFQPLLLHLIQRLFTRHSQALLGRSGKQRASSLVFSLDRSPVTVYRSD